jgi:subtilase family serine protease
LVAQTQNPDSDSFHRFVSLDEFISRFAPSSSDIAMITRYLDQFGITVTDVYADHLLLKATGTADAFNRAFAVDLHSFADGPRHFHRPRHAPKIPLLLRDLLVAVVGPSDEARFHPMHVRAALTSLAHRDCRLIARIVGGWSRRPVCEIW